MAADSRDNKSVLKSFWMGAYYFTPIHLLIDEKDANSLSSRPSPKSKLGSSIIKITPIETDYTMANLPLRVDAVALAGDPFNHIRLFVGTCYAMQTDHSPSQGPCEGILAFIICENSKKFLLVSETSI
ncbi:hypothetical protein BTUL_0056g00030 [Botrytis tulipae]|uniref:Uncharacterized protein n=1 Tax=Botrytis tulipae TaxID=87230 RepID=A0A4Z1EPA4_9HELO|nr:hypothetical protein BTUL_0056g00030 [Botrytis tulipae]